MKHLLGMWIGPIQGFISAARRTRDLWAGSLLLSEISKAAARAVWSSDEQALIFPNPPSPASDLSASSPYSVSNVILAEVNADVAAKLADRAYRAAEERWRTAAQDAFSELENVIHSGRFHEQLEGVIEFVWASAPLEPGRPYKDVRHEVMRTIAARKSCREFEPWKGYAKVPKSSLDGCRESIWIEDRLKNLPAWRKAQLRLAENEQLDAVGLAKRLGMGAKQFPSVARIAAQPWIESLEKDELRRLREACESFGAEDLIRYNTRKFSQFEAFPFEGDAVFLSRLHEIAPATEASEHRKDVLAGYVARLRQVLQEIGGRAGGPSPYLAVLQADGDRMGKAISEIENSSRHRDFSRALANFAVEANRVVIETGGALVFAGGDDVLALVPAHRALECASKLRAEFLAALRDFEGPTLSVGIAFGHFMEDLEDLLENARRAEAEAKQPDRNGLAVRYAPRHQEGRAFRCGWSSEPHELLTAMIDWHRKSLIPDQAAYQLSEMARHYAKWEAIPDLAPAMRADALRLLERKARKSDASALQRLRKLVGKAIETPEDLKRLADQLVITRKIAPIGAAR